MKVIAAGWDLLTPKLNWLKVFLRRNPSFTFVAIVSNDLQGVSEIDGIPVIRTAEIPEKLEITSDIFAVETYKKFS